MSSKRYKAKTSIITPEGSFMKGETFDLTDEKLGERLVSEGLATDTTAEKPAAADTTGKK